MTDTIVPPPAPPSEGVATNVIPGSGKQLAWYFLYGTVGLVAIILVLGYLQQEFTVGNINQAAVDYETNSINLVLSEEPPQLDSGTATDSVSGMLLGHVMEGLLRYNANDELIPGIAHDWEVSEQAARFHLREDAFWSDGTPVTAHDFVFAWRRALAVETASQYAFIMYPIKNAEKVNRGELPTEELGVTAVSDYELEIQLERPTPFFASLTAFTTFFPINEAFYKTRGDNYATNAEDLIFNGPFSMVHWAHDASVRLEKNPYYWNKDAVRLDAINFGYILRDSEARLRLFESGAIVFAGIAAENLDKALEKRWLIKEHNSGAVYFTEINHRPERLTANWNLRRALQLVNDPVELVNKVVKIPGFQPGESIFPTWIKGVDGYFRDEYPMKEHVPNPVLAREHLAKAMEELNLTSPPTLTLLSGDNPTSNKQSEYFQAHWRKHLGIEIRIDRQIFKQRLAKMQSGDFDLVLAGWAPDYDDGLTFGDLFASWNENNRGRYVSEYVDKNVRIAQNSTDPRERMEAFNKVQHRIYDDVAIILNYESGSLYVIDERVGGVSRRVIGADPDYAFAYLIDEES